MTKTFTHSRVKNKWKYFQNYGTFQSGEKQLSVQVTLQTRTHEISNNL
jgi:hypothetical protein